MRKWTLIIITFLLILPNTRAQDQVGCNQLLEDAKEAYQAGMVELVPELLIPCIETGLTGTLRQEAYILVINSYLFDYLPDQADSLMSDFLDDYPGYQPDPEDGSEFVILLESHQKLRKEQAEAVRIAEAEKERARLEEEQERAREEKEKKQREKKQKIPREVGETGSGAGFILGTNLAFPQLVEPYSTADPLTIDGNYSNASPGFHVGGAVSLQLSAGVETAFELLYQRTRFSYTATPYTFTSYEYNEVENRFSLPVSFIFKLNPESRTQAYLRLGIVADYLLSASASAVRTFTSGSNPDVMLEDTDITSSRSQMNLYGMGGAGIRILFQNSYLFFESRFQYGFLSGNKESERYDNQDLTWLIYHVDSDFKLHQLNISTGMIFNLK